VAELTATIDSIPVDAEHPITFAAVNTPVAVDIALTSGYQTAAAAVLDLPATVEAALDSATWTATELPIGFTSGTLSLRQTSLLAPGSETLDNIGIGAEDILVEAVPTNAAPAFDTGPTVGSITTSGCTITATFSDADADEVTATYRVVASGGTPNWTGAPSFTSPQAVSGLDAGTAYDAYVRLDDGTDATVSDAVPFETEAAPSMTRYYFIGNGSTLSTTQPARALLDAFADTSALFLALGNDTSNVAINPPVALNVLGELGSHVGTVNGTFGATVRRVRLSGTALPSFTGVPVLEVSPSDKPFTVRYDFEVWYDEGDDVTGVNIYGGSDSWIEY